MAFSQLYYTSCASGLAGYGGYQFNAATPGVPPEVMREIESRTAYEPPRSLPMDPGPGELARYPIAFSHTVSEADPVRTITAHVVFAGRDYSGRPGNYFAHALVSAAPDQDFGSMLPVELWGAGFWQRRPVDVRELPPLAGPLPAGDLDRSRVRDFLAARHADAGMPALLSAVDLAMSGDRPIMLVGQTPDENARWIAAISYLLGERLGRRLAFTTYSHRPGYSGHHVVGVLAGDRPADAEGFHVFDPGTGRWPEAGEHALAELLGRAGVVSAADLWRQAVALLPGPPEPEGFDGWYPAVAAAAVLLGMEVTPYDLDRVAGWLPAAAPALPDRHVEQLTRALADRALDRISSGERAPEPVPLVGRETVAQAARRGGELLRMAAPGTAAELLSWADGAGVPLPSEDLEACGRGLVGADIAEETLARLLTGRPAVVRGLVTRLAVAPREEAEAVLGGAAGGLIGWDLLTAHPELAEQWLVGSARRGRLARVETMRRVMEVRAAAGQPLADAGLLRRLWPGGCSDTDLSELLGMLRREQAPDVLDWLAGELTEAARRHDGTWAELSRRLEGHPVWPRLPAEVRSATRHVAEVWPALRRAQKGDGAAFGELYGAYPQVGGTTRQMLERDLAVLLMTFEPLETALRDCPQRIFDAFRKRAREQLRNPWRVDHRLAARMWNAKAAQSLAPRILTGLDAELEGVLEWKRRDIRQVARYLKGRDERSAERFTHWYSERRPSRVDRLKRRFPRGRGGDAPPLARGR